MATRSAMDAAASLRRTSRAQADAADPGASAWVSANAGTGKTHVLTMRVLRLLLAGTKPERILCLTYTKAAAAEMSKRVFSELARWVTQSEKDLSTALQALTDTAPDAETLARARTLFTHAIETPGGLKVQTIHSFCEKLLQRFPLEAGVPPSFSTLDEETAGTLSREAIDAMLSDATRAPDTARGRALRLAITYAADDSFDALLREAIRPQNRDWLEAITRLGGDTRQCLHQAEQIYRAGLGVRRHATAGTIDEERSSLLARDELVALRDLLLGGGKTDAELAQHIAAALSAPTAEMIATALARYFLTGSGELRSRLLTKKLKEERPDIDASVMRAQERFLALTRERTGVAVAEATIALITLALDVMQRYADAKARRAALDFDDLIRSTASLLRTRSSAEWVLFKLDGGLDHILVDESQDTSPEQWDVVQALATEFFTGEGAREEPRTLFAVGDEKQSIYSFQGAAPEMFQRMGERFADLARGAGQTWRTVPLTLSFRTVTPVLDAVDAVFADPRRAPGLMAAGGNPAHEAKRFDQAGLVEVWDTEGYVPPEEGDAWSPLAERTNPSPVERLASRIAATIAGWLSRGERLQSEDRPIRAGDILILVRKRKPFAGPMVAALKARGIPVAGADRMALTSQIAVMDLVALGDFLILPEDDLALASVLKSPIFSLDDDDLMRIGAGRKRTLWRALLDAAPLDPRYATSVAELKRWRKAADFSPPFEFYAALLDKEGLRARLLSRLGHEAADPIDEFLNLAIRYDDAAPPSLAGFLTWLRESDREVKRDMEHGRDEVRVMTVHGAKGLEAPIVFLPDTCTTASAARGPGSLAPLPEMRRPSGAGTPFVWPIKGASQLEPLRASNAARAARETEERNRLLYVAMTRARDRLYVAGFEGARGRAAGCWYDLVRYGLEGRLTAHETADGSTVWREASPQTGDHEKPKAQIDTLTRPAALPAFAVRNAAIEAPSVLPLAPSRLAPYEQDEEGEPLPVRRETIEPLLTEPPSPAPAVLAEDARFLRGTLTHALLEHLPGLPRAQWSKAAHAFVSRRGAGLKPRALSSIVEETLAILEDTRFAPLFASGSRAEVAIAAELPRPVSARPGPPLRLSGQIDRLAVTPAEVLIVDYKTNRPPPGQVADVAEAYLLQLAAYTLALRQIYPGRTVKAALLWTYGPRIMEIPPPDIEKAIDRLWSASAGPP